MDGYVRRGVESGARLLAGGRALTTDPDREGYFYAPTMFDDVEPDSALAREEIFGPVLPVIRVSGFDEAVAVANGTRYGLAAALFTTRMKLAHAFAQKVKAGMIHVNHGTASQAHVPFGGVKDSGQGSYSIGHTAKEFLHQHEGRLCEVVARLLPRKPTRARARRRRSPIWVEKLQHR